MPIHRSAAAPEGECDVKMVNIYTAVDDDDLITIMMLNMIMITLQYWEDKSSRKFDKKKDKY